MATSRFQGRARWETLGAVILTLAAGGAGYAHAQGESARSEAPPTSPTSRADEVQMSMPGMQMGPAAETRPSAASRPPDHVPITITPRVQQGIGVTIGRAHLAPLEMTIRTVGIVRPNETKVANIYVKTDGWVEKLFVSYTGQTVRAGDPLLTIYSPEFLVAQQEYLTALRAPKESMPTAPGQPSLIESSRRQLEFWDVPSPEIEELKRRGTPMKTLTLRCSIGGTVLEKNTFEGQRVSVRDKLYVVADLSTVWVQGKIYEYELPHVEVGQPARSSSSTRWWMSARGRSECGSSCPTRTDCSSPACSATSRSLTRCARVWWSGRPR
jgi:Cu(I)/Ag(I) efflux system membrane fusion protein